MSDHDASSSVSISLGPPGGEPEGHSSRTPDDRTVISKEGPVPPTGRTTPADLGKALCGERLEYFVLEEYVGGGGMGAVFRALDTRLNRDVALKVLSPEQGADDETRRRFLNEAQSAARLDHPNIARVYYIGEDRGLNFIVFEFIQGRTIRELVDSQGPLPLEEAISYLTQVAEALAHASGRDVVHRDIKPSNILITPEGHAKLVDMGLARLHQVSPASAELTASGVTLGTFDYISPEQARDPRVADVRSDIYSLGCTFYFMLTGRPPFPEGTVLQKLLQHQGDEPPDPRDFNPHLPDGVTQLLRTMLAKDPGRRFQSADDLLCGIGELAEQVGIQPLTWDRTSWGAMRAAPRMAFERHLPWIAPVAALLAIVLGLQLIDAWNEREARREREIASRPSRSRVADGERTIVAKPVESAPDEGVESGDPRESVIRDPESTAKPVDSDDSGADDPPLDEEFDSDRGGAGILATRGGRNGEFAPDLGPSEPAELKHPPASIEPAAPARIVDAKGALREFSSLNAACLAARSGDTIELAYNGRREEEAIVLSNPRLTIRAAEGYAPVIAFYPTDSDPLRNPREMFMVSGGSLAIDGVALELHAPKEIPDKWTMFRLQAVESISFERSSLTISNSHGGQTAYHPDAAFLRVEALPGSDSMMMTPTGGTMIASPTIISLGNCIVRGEAVVVRSEQAHPINLAWDNGLLATTEQLLFASGTSAAPRLEAPTRIVMRHVTALAQGGFFQFENSAENRRLTRTAVTCADCILISPRGAPLVAHQGASTASEFRSLFDWSAQRVFYERFDAMWTIDAAGEERETVRASGWASLWSGQEISSAWDRVRFVETLKPGDAENEMTPAEFKLEETSEGRGSAVDRTDAGMAAESLPKLAAGA